MKMLLKGLVRGYQIFLRPVLHALAGPHSGCRFHPSCSHYFLEALDAHGSLKGSYLGLRRLLRCHPWGACGEDPVPPSSSKLNSPQPKNSSL